MAAREPARARLPAGRARDRRRLRRLHGHHGRNRRIVRRLRRPRPAAEGPTWRQGESPGSCGAPDPRRDPRLLRREHRVEARCPEEARPQLCRRGRRVRVRQPLLRARRRHEPRGHLRPFRGVAATERVSLRVDHRRRRPDLCRPPPRLRGARSALRPRPRPPVPARAAWAALHRRAGGARLGEAGTGYPRRVSPQDPDVRALLADPPAGTRAAPARPAVHAADGVAPPPALCERGLARPPARLVGHPRPHGPLVPGGSRFPARRARRRRDPQRDRPLLRRRHLGDPTGASQLPPRRGEARVGEGRGDG